MTSLAIAPFIHGYITYLSLNKFFRKKIKVIVFSGTRYGINNLIMSSNTIRLA